MKFKIVNLIILSFLVVVSVLEAQSIKEDIASLDKDFKSFRYNLVIEKGNFLLADRFTTKSDSLQIYQYILSAAYSINDTILAKDVIKDILNTEPNFALNPLETSPKIIEFFNFVKRTTQNTQPSDSLYTQPTDSQFVFINNSVKSNEAIASVLYPGVGHLMKHERNKGYIFTSVTTILISTAIITTIKLDADREKYMDARGTANYDKLYNNYNTTYKLKNTMLVLYGIWNVYALFDLHKNQKINLGMSKKSRGLSVSLSIKL